jgi:imidazolonepropionase-like amidohydrolase
LTIYAAQVFGVDKLLGNVDAGKIVNMIVVDGDQLGFKIKRLRKCNARAGRQTVQQREK